MKERIRKLLDAAEPFCPGFNKSLSVRNDSGKLFGMFYLRDAAKRQDLELVLSAFEDILAGSRIYDIPSYDVVREEIVLARFEDIERFAIDDLGRIVDDVRAKQGDDEAYCLSIWLDPEQGGWSYIVRCEGAYQAALEEKRVGPNARFYESARSIQRFRFYDYATFQYDPSESLRSILGEIAERGYDNYVTYGERYLAKARSQLFELMTDAAAYVLRTCQANVVERLRTTGSFMTYVQYYDQDYFTEFRAVRRTVSEREIRAAMDELYGDFCRMRDSRASGRVQP